MPYKQEKQSNSDEKFAVIADDLATYTYWKQRGIYHSMPLIFTVVAHRYSHDYKEREYLLRNNVGHKQWVRKSKLKFYSLYPSIL